MRLGRATSSCRSQIALLGLTLTACEWVLGMGDSSGSGGGPNSVEGGGAGTEGGGAAGRTASGGSSARGGASAEGGTSDDAGAAGNGDEPSAGRGGASSGARGGATSGGRGGRSSAGGAGKASTTGGSGAGGSGGVAGFDGQVGVSGESNGGAAQGPNPPAPPGGEPFGATRVDGFEHVVYTTNDAHIAELYYYRGDWFWVDLHKYISMRPGHTMPPPGHSPFAFGMSDDSDSIVYVDTNGFITELSLRSGDWEWRHLTSLSPESGSAGPPVGYRRANALAGVAYVNTTTGHVHELSLSWGGQWTSADLTDLTGASPSGGAPFPHKRTDGLLSILTQTQHGNGPIVEILGDGTDWSAASLAADSSGATMFDRSDGVSSLIDVDAASQHVLERTLGEQGWSEPFDLGAATGAPAATGRPFGFLRTDRLSSIVFQTLDHHLRELVFREGAWSDAGSPTVSSDCPPVASKTDARPNVRPNGDSAVHYGSELGKIYELLHVGGVWVCKDLTFLTTL